MGSPKRRMLAASLRRTTLSLPLIFSPFTLAQSNMSAPAVTHTSFTPKHFDKTVSSHVQDAMKDIASKDLSKDDLGTLEALYKEALDTRHTRGLFLASVDKYQSLLKSNAGLLDREQGYYEMGNRAASLLQAVNQLDDSMSRYASQIDLHFRSIGFELGQYQNQRGLVLHPLLDKPKLLGMKQNDLQELTKSLAENGRHLDAAIDSLRDAILRSHPNSDVASLK